jgi:hypothetical protein
VSATLNELAATRDAAEREYHAAVAAGVTGKDLLAVARAKSRTYADHERELSAIGERQRARIAEVTPVPAKVTKRRGEEGAA